MRTATEVARSDFWLSCSFCSEESRQIFLPKEGFEECKLQEERAGVCKQVPNHLKQQKGRTSVAGKTSHAEQGLSSWMVGTSWLFQDTVEQIFMDSQKVTQRCNRQPAQHLLGAFENAAFCIFFVTQGDLGSVFKAFQLIPTLWFVGSTVRQTLTDRRTESVELSFSFFYAGYSTRLLSFIKCPPSEVPCLSHCLSWKHRCDSLFWTAFRTQGILLTTLQSMVATHFTEEKGVLK